MILCLSFQLTGTKSDGNIQREKKNVYIGCALLLLLLFFFHQKPYCSHLQQYFCIAIVGIACYLLLLILYLFCFVFFSLLLNFYIYIEMLPSSSSSLFIYFISVLFLLALLRTFQSFDINHSCAIDRDGHSSISL